MGLRKPLLNGQQTKKDYRLGRYRVNAKRCCPDGHTNVQYSIVNFSQIEAVEDFRIDAEYWHPIFIRNSTLVLPDKRLRDFVYQNIANIKSSPISRDFEYLEISQISLGNFEYQTATVKLGEKPDRAHHLLRRGDVVVSTVRPNRNAIAFIKPMVLSVAAD